MVMDLTGKDYRKIESFVIINQEVFNYYTGKKMGVLADDQHPSSVLQVIQAMTPVVEEKKEKIEEPDEEPKKFSIASLKRGRGRPKKEAE